MDIKVWIILFRLQMKKAFKVANKLFISQPALSLQIKKLEETFGTSF